MKLFNLTAATKVQLVDTVRALQEARDEPIHAHSTLMRLRPEQLRERIETLCDGRWIVSEDGNIHDSKTKEETQLDDTVSYTDLDTAIDEDLSGKVVVVENLNPGYMEDGLDVVSDQVEIEETKTRRARAPKDGVIRVLGEFSPSRDGSQIRARRDCIRDGMALADYVAKASPHGGAKHAVSSLRRLVREGSVRIDEA